MMKMSFHRRRSQSLPPQPARSGKLIIVVGLLLSATVAFAASRMGRSEPAAMRPDVTNAEQGTSDFVDERVRLHLRSIGN